MPLLWAVAFALSPLGAHAAAVLTTLNSFGISPYPQGGGPGAALVQGSDGHFFGTTSYGGTNGSGTVFKISADGALTTLYSFGSVRDTNGVAMDGATPNWLIQGSDGYFYGTTQNGGTNNRGTVFRINTDAALTTLYAFGSIANADGWPLDGGSPNAGLVQGSDGSFYGTTEAAGTNNAGTVFKITPAMAFTTLYSFGSVQAANGGALDGVEPVAALVQGSDGYFYGTTIGGGAYYTNQVGGSGTVFRISPLTGLSTLYSFTGGNAGANPSTTLVQGTDGSLYGTARQGGTIFRLTILPEFQAMALSNSALSLTWTTEAGGTYQLQYNSDLNSTNWTNLGGPVTATGLTLTATDPVTSGPQRFYRLVLAP